MAGSIKRGEICQGLLMVSCWYMSHDGHMMLT